jgi:hypothetical protein
VVTATPLWLLILPVQFRGIEALADFPPEPADWIFGSILTLIGLLLVGLPVASLIGRQNISLRAKMLFLLATGAAGGAVVAVLFMTISSVGGRAHWTAETLPAILTIGAFGFVPGAIVALVWIGFNSRTLGRAQVGLEKDV